MLNVQQSRLLRRLKANLSTIGESSRALADEVTMSLILWIYKNFKNKNHVDEVLQCLINSFIKPLPLVVVQLKGSTVVLVVNVLIK